jgi:hypothetical protein
MVRYEFDGEQLTAGQVSRRYPAYSPQTCLQALREGCKSLADLQARDRACAARLRRSQIATAASVQPSVAKKPGTRRDRYHADVSSMGMRRCATALTLTAAGHASGTPTTQSQPSAGKSGLLRTRRTASASTIAAFLTLSRGSEAMDDDDVRVALWGMALILLALCVIVFAGWAYAAHASRPVVIVTEDGEALRGRFVAAELGEPITVLVDTSAVFGSGFEP